MARNPDLPKPEALILIKNRVPTFLQTLDVNQDSRERILKIENDFRSKIQSHLESLPTSNSKFRRFNTSPFVLLMQSLRKGYTHISQIESDILPSKQFSSMETSAGRMVEEIVLPIYGWSIVPSAMHTEFSALDGMKLEKGKVKLATLKSGPRCLNDEMSENFADQILSNTCTWADKYDVDTIDFTYGVLYGTKKMSNKKDWHILRNIKEKLGSNNSMILDPANRWGGKFIIDGVNLNIDIRIGKDWWEYLCPHYGLYEMIIAIIRATISPTNSNFGDYEIEIDDLENIINPLPYFEGRNIAILQKSQLPWLYLMLYHFYDKFEEKLS